MVLASLVLPVPAVADVGGAIAEALHRTAGDEPVPGAAAAPTGYAAPVVVVVNAYAESPEVRAFYGYQSDQGNSSSPAPPPLRGDRRFERMRESRVGSDRGVTYVEEAMNSTVIASIDEAGTVDQTCIHGAAEDITAHMHAPHANAEGERDTPYSTNDGLE